MTTAFQEAFEKIIKQKQILKSADERAVELAVLLPLLSSIDWDTTNLSEVYPQEGFHDSKDKVDYALQIDNRVRVYIEAKKWQKDLDPEEKQLLRYFIAAGKNKPRLGVLTNGSEWRFYLAPLKPKRKKDEPKLRRFLVLDIVNGKLNEVESYFWKLLSRKSILPGGGAISEGRKLWEKHLEDKALMDQLTKAWNRLAVNANDQEEVLSFLAEKRDIEVEEEHVRRFIKANGFLYKTVDVAPKRKRQLPTTFTLANEETVEVHSWPSLKEKFCESMYKRHPDIFADVVLNDQKFMDWFQKSDKKPKRFKELGDSGIFIKEKGSKDSIKTLCSDLLDAFDYPEKSLTIHINQP